MDSNSATSSRENPKRSDTMLDLTSALASALILLSAFTVYFHLKAFTYWSSRGVKGPLPVPIFGTNVYYLFKNKLELDQRWRRQYGKTYGLYEGYSPLLRTSDHELIKFIYIQKFHSFTDRHNEFVHEKVSRNWLFWLEGERWANQRALLSPMFSSGRMKTMAGSMSSCVNRFLADVRERLEGAGARPQRGAEAPQLSSEQVLFSKTDLANMTLDVLATTLFGLKLDTYRELSKNEFFARARNFAEVNLLRVVVWFLIPRQLARWLEFDIFNYPLYAYFDRLSQHMINTRRKEAGHSPRAAPKQNDLMQMLLDAELADEYEQVFSEEDDREAHYNGRAGHQQLERVQRQQAAGAKFRRFSDLEIRGQMVFLFLAGFETTASALNSCVYELAHKTEIQERLHDELRAAIGRGPLAAGREFPSELYSDLLNLKLLDAFVCECLRIYSPILEHNRRAVEPVELPNGLKLPAGMPIATNPFVVQRDAEYFPRPDEFDISRFMPQNRDQIKTATFIPFGLGPRHCPGMRFALLEIKLALAKILVHYRISPGPKTIEYPPKFDQNLIFLTRSANDFSLTPRSAV